MLLGPANADHFRVKVGRYGDRWYTDPLPSCPIAPYNPTWKAPSVSWTKPPFSNKYVPMRSIADMAADEWARLATVPADARYEAIKSHDKLAGRVNMDRGSVVHAWAEDRLLGRVPLFAEPARWADGALEQAEKFRPALEAFFEHYQPEPYAVEAVCLHRTLNGVGYGGTMDALVKIDGELWAIDWKSRNSDHAAYLEEAAQGGAYIGAEYMIVAGDDGAPCRVRMPKVAGVLIVSIRSDGYRAYPIDAERAITAYADMHAWAIASKMTHNDIVGHPWAPRAAVATPPVDDRRAALRDRFTRLVATDPDAGAQFRARNIDPDDLDAIEDALDDLDPFSARNTAVTAPPVTPRPKLEKRPEQIKVDTPPDEGADGDPAAFEVLKQRFTDLDPAGRSWIAAIAAGALDAGAPFGAGTTKTVRRFEIYRGLIALAGNDHCDDELVRELVATAVESDSAFHPTYTTGYVVGAMHADQARRFADLSVALCDDVAAVELRRRAA